MIIVLALIAYCRLNNNWHIKTYVHEQTLSLCAVEVMGQKVL